MMKMMMGRGRLAVAGLAAVATVQGKVQGTTDGGASQATIVATGPKKVDTTPPRSLRPDASVPENPPTASSTSNGTMKNATATNTTAAAAAAPATATAVAGAQPLPQEEALDVDVNPDQVRYHVCPMLCHNSGSAWETVEELCDQLPLDDCALLPAETAKMAGVENDDQAYFCKSKSTDPETLEEKERQALMRVRFRPATEVPEEARNPTPWERVRGNAFRQIDTVIHSLGFENRLADALDTVTDALSLTTNSTFSAAGAVGAVAGDVWTESHFGPVYYAVAKEHAAELYQRAAIEAKVLYAKADERHRALRTLYNVDAKVAQQYATVQAYLSLFQEKAAQHYATATDKASAWSAQASDYVEQAWAAFVDAIDQLFDAAANLCVEHGVGEKAETALAFAQTEAQLRYQQALEQFETARAYASVFYAETAPALCQRVQTLARAAANKTVEAAEEAGAMPYYKQVVAFAAPHYEAAQNFSAPHVTAAQQLAAPHYASFVEVAAPQYDAAKNATVAFATTAAGAPAALVAAVGATSVTEAAAAAAAYSHLLLPTRNETKAFAKQLPAHTKAALQHTVETVKDAAAFARRAALAVVGFELDSSSEESAAEGHRSAGPTHVAHVMDVEPLDRDQKWFEQADPKRFAGFCSQYCNPLAQNRSGRDLRREMEAAQARGDAMGEVLARAELNEKAMQKKEASSVSALPNVAQTVALRKEEFCSSRFERDMKDQLFSPYNMLMMNAPLFFL